MNRLGCLRGIGALTGLALAVEIGDWSRLDGRRIGAYLGLTPTESSSSASRSLGGITKTGNGHARRLLDLDRGAVTELGLQVLVVPPPEPDRSTVRQGPRRRMSSVL